MYIETEGIILKQTKTVNNRRMVLLFTKKYGKISAGTGIAENGKNKSSLALRPFTLGKYSIKKNGDYYNIVRAETVRSHYNIGEDIDKYLNCAYVLELTDKVISEGDRNPRAFNLLLDFFQIMEKRTKKFETIVVAYEVKLLNIIGLMPLLSNCVKCGNEKSLDFFSVKEGGVICNKCYDELVINTEESLIFQTNFVIISSVQFFIKNPLSSLEKMSLEDKLLKDLKAIIKIYLKYHLEISELKSEKLF